MFYLPGGIDGLHPYSPPSRGERSPRPDRTRSRMGRGGETLPSPSSVGVPYRVRGGCGVSLLTPPGFLSGHRGLTPRPLWRAGPTLRRAPDRQPPAPRHRGVPPSRGDEVTPTSQSIGSIPIRYRVRHRTRSIEFDLELDRIDLNGDRSEGVAPQGRLPNQPAQGFPPIAIDIDRLTRSTSIE